MILTKTNRCLTRGWNKVMSAERTTVTMDPQCPGPVSVKYHGLSPLVSEGCFSGHVWVSFSFVTLLFSSHPAQFKPTDLFSSSLYILTSKLI